MKRSNIHRPRHKTLHTPSTLSCEKTLEEKGMIDRVALLLASTSSAPLAPLASLPSWASRCKGGEQGKQGEQAIQVSLEIVVNTQFARTEDEC